MSVAILAWLASRLAEACSSASMEDLEAFEDAVVCGVAMASEASASSSTRVPSVGSAVAALKRRRRGSFCVKDESPGSACDFELVSVKAEVASAR